jgi:flagellar motor protein MotB
MATFADMATLLMAFFVLILSFAEFNVPKFKQISGSLREAFGVAESGSCCGATKRHDSNFAEF